MGAVEEVRIDYAVLRSCWVYGGCNVEGREGQGGPRVLQGCCVRRVPWVEVSDGWVGGSISGKNIAGCRSSSSAGLLSNSKMLGFSSSMDIYLHG